MPVNLYNKWRLEVLEAIHNWPNRYVIFRADSAKVNHTAPGYAPGRSGFMLLGDHVFDIS